MGDKWTTSGRARLKAQQKPGFAALAHHRPAIAPPAMLISRNLATNSAKSHPRLRQQSAEGTGSYSTYADPIARRGIAVSLRKPGAQPHHPLHPARRIRNLHERSAIISHYYSDYRRRQCHQQLLHQEAGIHRLQSPPLCVNHAAYSARADPSEGYFPVRYSPAHLQDPSFTHPSQLLFSPPHHLEHYAHGSAPQLPVAPPYQERFCIPQIPFSERPFGDELTFYSHSPFSQRFEEYERAAPLFDSCAQVTENGSQISEVDMFDRECITTNSDETFSTLSKQQALPSRECAMHPEQLFVQHRAGPLHSVENVVPFETNSRYCNMDVKEAFNFKEFELGHHKEPSPKRGIDRFRSPGQRDKSFAKFDSKKSGLNRQCHQRHPIITMPKDSLNEYSPFEKDFLDDSNKFSANESARTQLTQKRGIDRFSRRQQKQEEHDNVISDYFQIFQSHSKHQRPATAMARLQSLPVEQNETKPFVNKVNMPQRSTWDTQNEFDSFNFETDNELQSNQLTNPTQWNPIVSRQSKSCSGLKPVRFFNEGLEVDIQNRLLSRPGSPATEQPTTHY